MSNNYNIGDTVSAKHSKGAVITGVIDGVMQSSVSIGGLWVWKDMIEVTVTKRAVPKEPGVGSAALVKIVGGVRGIVYTRGYSGWISISAASNISWADLHDAPSVESVTVLWDSEA